MRAAGGATALGMLAPYEPWLARHKLAHVSTRHKRVVVHALHRHRFRTGSYTVRVRHGGRTIARHELRIR